MKLQKYAGREGSGEFRSMTLDEAKSLSYGCHVWILALDGSARRVKVNGQPKTWKRDASRIEIPLKYGMYEYATFTASDLDRLLIEVVESEEQN